MSFRFRLLLGYFAVIGLAAYALLDLAVDTLKPAARQAMEETMVDTANLLAELAAPEMRAGRWEGGVLDEAVRRSLERLPQATIAGQPKQHLPLRVYVTDARGIVLYDSSHRAVGMDYARWNDVYLTLRGRYGARSSPGENDPSATISYVAAPILDEGRIIGVLTLAKPNQSVQPYIDLARQQVQRLGAALVAVTLALGLLFSWGLIQSVRRLSAFAATAGRGERQSLPRLSSTELRHLGQAVSQMRDAIEGKAYVEHYVQTLTHEMKSPIAAIHSAAELLTEPMPPADHARFVGNIQSEAQRLQRLVERLLDLAVLEKRGMLEDAEPLDLTRLAQAALASRRALLAERGLTLRDTQMPSHPLRGSAFLLEQAIGNLLDNSIAFAPRGSVLSVDSGPGHWTLEDGGPGIPDFAGTRIFERFYSLPRPDTGRKSSGLGLNFVAEIMALHGGSATVENRAEGGARAVLHFPSAA